jgi:RsiW-degrading membrane proteinase PrsW (M82 family)
MLSTAPILFYSELTQRHIELNFILFKVIPVNFGTSSQQFVSESVFKNFSGTQAVVLTTLVTYLTVGFIEEVSKYWVLRHSSRDFFRSIDDVLQLSIIVALGFAFAENLVNPTYFVGFVQQYLLSPAGPQWGPFIGSVVGRSVLTIMVHILSTGVTGYFFGLAFYASPLIRDQFEHGKFHPVIESMHRMLSLRTERIYARYQILIGLTCAIISHGLFDFTVTLPDVLPGNPATVGQLLGSPPQSFLNTLSITLLPSVLYVVGGFWLLAYLFQRKEDMKDFGQVVDTQTYVS